MQTIVCPLCGGAKEKLLFTRRDLTYRMSDQEFRIVKCRRCGLSYVNPRPNQEEMLSYYPDDFYRTSLGATELLLNQAEILLLKLKHLPILPPGRLLDIGCARGEFLYVMRALSWEVQGVEFSPRAVNPFGLEIFTGQLSETGWAKNSFDLVTMWAVLEHIAEPLPLLREIRRVLKPSGKLKILVTNMRSLPGRLMRIDDIPRHLILFSPSSLKHMLRLAGFKNITLNFDARLYGSHHRTLLILLYKILRGGGVEELVEERHRDWAGFCTTLNGRASPFLAWLNGFDNRIYPKIDWLMDKLGLGANILAEAS